MLIMKHIFVVLLLFMVAGISAQTTPTKTQCTALTVKGVQCKKFATTGIATCTIHSTNAARCGATTKANTPCKMRVKVSGDKCRHHSAPKQ